MKLQLPWNLTKCFKVFKSNWKNVESEQTAKFSYTGMGESMGKKGVIPLKLLIALSIIPLGHKFKSCYIACRYVNCSSCCAISFSNIFECITMQRYNCKLRKDSNWIGLTQFNFIQELLFNGAKMPWKAY